MFPACQTCNNGSSRDDALVAFLSRLNIDVQDGTPEAHEWSALLAALREHYPGLTREMILSANEVRRWMQQRGLAKPPGIAYGEVPIVKIPSVMVQAVRRFNAKLLRALHYKHTGRIVPASAWTRLQWWTNANLVAGEFPREIAALMPGRAILQRGKVSLGDQFGYAYGTGEDGTLGAYLATFRKCFAVVGLVVFDASRMADVDERQMQNTIEQATGLGNAADAANPDASDKK